MIQEAFRLSSPADGLPLGGLWILPETPPKAVIQLCHGMCERKERYLPLMNDLAQRGFACVIHDHRGHGESVRAREDLGYFYQNGADALLADIGAINRLAHERFPGLPLILFGHSMGSLAVRAFARRHDDRIDGLIICGSPSRPTGLAAGHWLVFHLGLLRGEHVRCAFADRLVMGSFNRAFANEGANAWLSTDPAVAEAYNNDPLCSFTFTLNGYDALLTLMAQAYAHDGWLVRNPDLPVLFVSGEDDPCRISHKKFLQAVEHMKTRGYADVSWKIYPGMRHEIMNERGREEVVDDLSAFCEKCCPAAPSSKESGV